MKSILQPWVMELGLRHQGVLVSSVRGCDSAVRHDPSKRLARALRAEILVAHVGDPKKAKTFIEAVDESVLRERMEEFLNSSDHYPNHYVLHLMHAAEIVGYKHPQMASRDLWSEFYFKMCKKLHVNRETEAQLDARLNADEEAFHRAQDMTLDDGNTA